MNYDALEKVGKLLRDPGVEIDLYGFMFALIISGLVCLLISFMYQYFYENRSTGSQIHRSFLLVGPSVTALFIAVQFSLPLSLGLLGALSIIRFRTPVKEPEEVGFIMLVVACSVVTATFQFVLLAALLFIVFIFLSFQKLIPGLRASKKSDGLLLVVIDGEVNSDNRTKILTILDKNVRFGKLQGLAMAGGITTINYSFSKLKSENIDMLENEIGRVVAIKKMNFFFNNQGAII